jgi:hypothetical protein
MEKIMIISLLIILCGYGMVRGLVYLGKRNIEDERKYNFLYDYIAGHIDSMPVNDQNYNLLKSDFDRLGKMRYKNPEKTYVLRILFERKFGKITAERALDGYQQRLKQKSK